MKNTAFILVVLFSLGSFAAKAGIVNDGSMLKLGSEVVVSPDYPVNCESYNYKSVNRIFEIETRESDSLIVVSFKTAYGSCQYRETMGNVYIRIIGDAFYSLFAAYPAKGIINISNEDSTLGLVTLTFDKKRIFRKTSAASFAYSLVRNRDSEYRWTIKLTQLSDNTTFLQFE